MKREQLARGVASWVGVFLLTLGAWAFISPITFWERVALFEPYNPHFVRDTGAFQLGLGAALLLALQWKDALLVALGAAGAGSVAHFAGHVLDQDLGGGGPVDLIVLGIVALALVLGFWWRLRTAPSDAG